MQQFTPGIAPERANELAESGSIRAHNTAMAGTAAPLPDTMRAALDVRQQAPGGRPVGQQSWSDVAGNQNLAGATARAREATAADQALAQQRQNATNVAWGGLGSTNTPTREYKASPGDPGAWGNFVAASRNAMESAKAGDTAGYDANRVAWQGSRDGRATVPVDEGKQQAARDKRTAIQADRQRNVMLQRNGYNPVDVQMAEAAQQQARELAMQEMATKRYAAGMQSLGMAGVTPQGGQYNPAAMGSVISGFNAGQGPQWGRQGPQLGAAEQSAGQMIPMPPAAPMTPEAMAGAGAALRDQPTQSFQQILAMRGITDPAQAQFLTQQEMQRRSATSLPGRAADAMASGWGIPGSEGSAILGGLGSVLGPIWNPELARDPNRNFNPARKRPRKSQ